MVKIGDRVQIDEAVSNYYGRCGVVVGDDYCVTFPYRVAFDDDDICIFNGSDLIVLSTEEEKVMKFKVGDKVKVSNSWEGRSGEVGEITRRNIWEAYPCRVTFEDGVYESFKEEELELVKEEEKVMKFKVGDKVRVKDSWFGHDGQVGVVFKIDNYEPYNYSVKFDVEGDNERRDENFKGDSLELVTQQFTKSDLKTGMGVVLRSGDKAHVLLGTLGGDVLRFPDIGAWSSLDRIGEDLLSESGERYDIVEVYGTEWSFKYLTDRVFEEDCLFKREEPKPEPTKMTMKEINEHFGKAIEIVE